MKYLLLALLTLTGCGLDVHGHLDEVKVQPVQVIVSTNVNYTAAQAFCNGQCNGDTICGNACFNQFIAVLTASSSLPVPTPSPTP